VPPLIEVAKFEKVDGHPKGAVWSIPDEEALARSIAQIALGQWHHVAAFIASGDDWVDPPVDYAIDGAIKMLRVPPGSEDWLIWHRDGWLFQAISWIAAVETGRGPTRPPHMIHADKGLDGPYVSGLGESTGS
jgi:hypothetical protein